MDFYKQDFFEEDLEIDNEICKAIASEIASKIQQGNMFVSCPVHKQDKEQFGYTGNYWGVKFELDDDLEIYAKISFFELIHNFIKDFKKGMLESEQFKQVTDELQSLVDVMKNQM